MEFLSIGLLAGSLHLGDRILIDWQAEPNEGRD